MPTLLFSELAVSQIQKFIHLYEEGFFTLYKDSGLSAEQTIIENYQKTATELSDNIFHEIEVRLTRKNVLGRKEKNSWQEITFHVGDRLIIVYYSEYKESNTRLIESIGIDRKPIIF